MSAGMGKSSLKFTLGYIRPGVCQLSFRIQSSGACAVCGSDCTQGLFLLPAGFLSTCMSSAESLDFSVKKRILGSMIKLEVITHFFFHWTVTDKMFPLRLFRHRISHIMEMERCREREQWNIWTGRGSRLVTCPSATRALFEFGGSS